MASFADRAATGTPLHRVGRYLVDHARGVAVVTLGLTFFLVLLGLFTAAAGAGATCNYTYPGCAGQLSPIGLSLPQFIEWFHRLVAMLTGYVILANAAVLWYRFRGARTSRAGVLAALLLPLQVFFGGVTVTFATLFPGGYTPSVQLTHFGAALAIYLALVAAFVWADMAVGRGATAERLYLVGVAGLGLTGFQSLFARNLVFTFWPSVQTAYHAFGLLAVAAFVAAVLWSRDLGVVDGGLVGGIGAVVGIANAFLVIGIFLITTSVEVVTYGLLFVQLVLFAWLARVGARTPSRATD
ncbi:MAG: COX15/CtaA family protein [Halanaeroarchaeum sp.]